MLKPIICKFHQSSYFIQYEQKTRSASDLRKVWKKSKQMEKVTGGRKLHFEENLKKNLPL